MDGRLNRVATGQRVLVVDGIPETEEVLRAVFEGRGCQVGRIRSRGEVREPDREETPHVVVIDADAPTAPQAEENAWDEVPRVVLGARVMTTQATVPSRSALFLEKPFQYPELVRAVERLLSNGNEMP